MVLMAERARKATTFKFNRETEMDQQDDRTTERHTDREALMLEVRRQRIANLQTLLLMARFNVPILRETCAKEKDRA